MENISMSDPITSAIDFNLSFKERKISLSDIEEFRNWISSQTERWSFLRNNELARLGAMSGLELLTAINRDVKKLSLTDGKFFEDDLSGIKQRLISIYDSNNLFLPDTKNDNFISELLKKHNNETVSLVFYYLSPFYKPEVIKPLNSERWALAHIEAYNLAQNFLKGNEQTYKAVEEEFLRQSKKDLHEFQSATEVAMQNYESMQDDLKSLNNRYSSNIATHEEQMQSQQKKLSELKDKATQEWEALKETFRADLALKAPVTYWSDEKKSYFNQAWLFGSMFVFLIYMFGEGIKHILDKEVDTTFLNVHISHLLLVAVTLSLGIWVITLVAKIFLSRLHLHNEASQRVTLLKTYLALLQDNQADKVPLEHILKAILVPTNAGLIRDNGPVSNATLLGILQNKQ